MKVLSSLRYRCALSKLSAASQLRTLCMGILTLGCMVPCIAEEAKVIMIEEQWEMVINEPDPNSHSPQVTFFTAPSGESENTYFQLQMNYAADEAFSGGGFHVAAVNGAVMIDEERSQTKVALTTAHDHIRWTNVMALIGDNLYFAVKDGHCGDWGVFGGPEYLVAMPTSLSDLSGYDAQKSLSAVDIGFGGNRVNNVVLRSVVRYYSDGRQEKVLLNQQL